MSISSLLTSAAVLLAAVLISLELKASAQLATCLNQCDALAYQCERSVNDEYQMCVERHETQVQACEREGNDRRNYCLQNRAPSCDLSGQLAFDSCMQWVEPCELNGQRCDERIRTCVQRCERDEASRTSSLQPRNARPKQSPKERPLNALAADYLAAQQPQFRVYKFEHSDQLNEFKLVDEDFLFVRNLHSSGRHGPWHEYHRISPEAFEAVSSNATYTLTPEDKFVWSDGRRTITLIRHDE